MTGVFALLADSGIPVWPVNSLTALFGGFLLVVVVLVVSAVVLARVQGAEKERRLDAQIEEDRRRRVREAAEEAEVAAADSPRGDAATVPADDDT